eukprot:TRINITY_DN4536_c0_g1_i1.p1 TRINITY_DN4536_c0_g1~~TRINITY_DN4536_c0_g1_i1.p1  ORF type:complete len:112 (-),score=26.97 TRINITY_DN4536_c0_g1_i1:213-548(-)
MGEPEFQEPEFQEPQYKEPEAPPQIDVQEQIQEPEPPQYEEPAPDPEEQLVSPIQAEPIVQFNQQSEFAPVSYNQQDYAPQYQMPEQTFEADDLPERSTLDLVHKSYEAGD